MQRDSIINCYTGVRCPSLLFFHGVVDFTCSNVTFLGKGIDTTTILGGLSIVQEKNIMLKQMTVTNTYGDGITIVNSKIEMVDVAIKKCSAGSGLNINNPVDHKVFDKEQVVATRCQFTENESGVWATIQI